MRQLDLSHNQIASIDAGTFAVTPQLRHVWLQHNQLTAVSAEAFAGAAQLQTVDLSANRIVAVDANAFRDAAASLTDVSLAANPLVLSTMVPLFSGATALRTLDLAGCNLTELHGSTFDGLTGLIGLNLRNNSLDEVSGFFLSGRMLPDAKVDGNSEHVGERELHSIRVMHSDSRL